MNGMLSLFRTFYGGFVDEVNDVLAGEVAAERYGDVLRTIAELLQHRHESVGGADTSLLHDVRRGYLAYDGVASQAFVGGKLLVERSRGV